MSTSSACPRCGTAIADCEVYGWAAIAGIVEMSITRVRLLARRRFDPLPAWRYLGKIVATHSELMSWRRRQRRPFAAEPIGTR